MSVTKGPWRVENGFIMCGATGDGIIAEMFTGPMNAMGSDANAALIAAAPDLLEACKSMENGISELQEYAVKLCELGDMHLNEVIRGLIASSLVGCKAIAKAKVVI